MIRGLSDAYPYAKVEFPLWRQIEIDGGYNLLLLVAKGIETGNRAKRSVVLDPGIDLLREIPPRFEVG